MYRIIVNYALILFLLSNSKADNDSYILDYNFYIRNVFFQYHKANLSNLCMDAMVKLNFLQSTLYDANSKVPSGLLHGRYNDFGNFDECINFWDTPSEKYRGKYCLGETKLNFEQPVDYPKSLLRTGFCLPSDCTLEDFKTLFYKHNFNNENCHLSKRNDSRSTGFIILCLMFTLIAILNIAASLYDINKIGEKNEAVMIFSLMRNCETLFSIKKNDKEICCLNGLKSLAMLWVLFHHVLNKHTTVSSLNLNYVYEVESTFLNAFLSQGVLSVDVFLVIGGILSTYSILKKKERKSVNLIWNWIERYFRLTSVLAVMILVNSFLFEMGNGPLWSYVESFIINSCKKNWWPTLLYLQNYVQPAYSCVFQGWYLAVDLQCYIIFSLLLFLNEKFKWKIKRVLYLLIIIGVIINFYAVYGNKIIINPLNILFPQFDIYTYFGLYLEPTHVRFLAYAIGVLFGHWIYSADKRKLNLSSTLKSTILVIIMCVFLIDCYCPYFLNEDPFLNGIFGAMQRATFCFAIGTVIYMCKTNNAEMLNYFLSLPVFKVLARLTFCMYMIGDPIQWIRIASTRVPLEFSIYYLGWQLFGDVLWNLAFSIPMYVMVELPFTGLASYIIRKSRRN